MIDGVRVQDLVRIDCSRLRDATEQRQIVVRVAVEKAVAQCLFVDRKPVFKHRDLAILKTGYPGDAAGIATVT